MGADYDHFPYDRFLMDDRTPDDFAPVEPEQTPEGGHPYRLTVNFDADSLLHAQLLVSLVEKTVRKSLSTRPDFVFEELDVQLGAEVLLPQFGMCAADQVVMP